MSKTNPQKNNLNRKENGGIMKSVLINYISGRSKKSDSKYLDIYINALNQASDLLKEAEILFKNEAYQRAYFLAFSALEEISKSQLAADVYTGLIREDKFKKAYKNHKKKIERVKWIQIDGNSYPYFQWDQIKIDDFDFEKKLKAMYVDIDFETNTIHDPSQSISKKDAEKIIKATNVGLYQIYYTTEILGEQIGTKGFMK